MLAISSMGKRCKCGLMFTEWKRGNVSGLPGTFIDGWYRHCPGWKWWQLWGHDHGESQLNPPEEVSNLANGERYKKRARELKHAVWGMHKCGSWETGFATFDDAGAEKVLADALAASAREAEQEAVRVAKELARLLTLDHPDPTEVSKTLAAADALFAEIK